MLLFGQDKLVAEWVSLKLFGTSNGFDQNAKAVGIVKNNKLIAGVVYNNYVEKILVEMSIASVDKSWCTRYNLKMLFGIPFTQYNLGRVQAICSVNDEGVQDFLQRLGFIHEGTHRQAYQDGGDAMSFAMLKHECKWIDHGKKIPVPSTST